MELKGEYSVIYKHPEWRRKDGSLYRFAGICENFVGSGGNCVFRNDKDEVIIVQFEDIIQMRPFKKSKVV